MPVNYNVNPLGGFDVQGALQGLGQQFGQIREQEELKQRRESLQNDIRLASGGDPDAMDSLMGKNPNIAILIQDRNRENEQRLGAQQALVVKNTTTDFAQRFINASDEERPALIQEAEADQNIDFDREDAQQPGDFAARAIIYQNRGKDFYKTFLGGGRGADIGAASPKDFTAESLAQYEKSGNIADLVRYSPKTVKVAGVDHQFNAESQKWEPIVDVTTKKLSVQASALADIAADKKSRLDFAKSSTKWKTGRPKFQSKITSAKSSQKILEATSAQIKKHVNGLTTKYGASLSGIPGSEARLLKNQLNTLKAHSAFSTLTDLKAGGGTLGAISEKELILLESKLGALDQGGDATELMRVIDQIVNSNLSSISRLQTEFDRTDVMYNKSFDDFQAGQAPLSDEDLLLKYGG